MKRKTKRSTKAKPRVKWHVCSCGFIEKDCGKKCHCMERGKQAFNETLAFG